MDYLKLMRYKNVLFIAFVQILIYWAVIVPILSIYGLQPATPSWVMCLLITSTMLLSAGAYIINDYFDVKIDRINRPDKLIVTRGVQKHEAMRFYQIMTALGVTGGVVASIFLNSITTGFIYVVVPGMMWFYSASYKRQLIIGNLIVSISAALVPLVPLIAEAASLDGIYSDLLYQTPTLRHLYSVVCGFVAFVFFFVLILEIIKDLESESGDREMECHTIPVVWGTTVSKIIITALIIIANGMVAYAVSGLDFAITGYMSMRYYIFGISLPSVCLLVILWCKFCTAYENALSLTKFILVIGILYTIMYCYLVAKQYHVPMFGLFQVL